MSRNVVLSDICVKSSQVCRHPWRPIRINNSFLELYIFKSVFYLMSTSLTPISYVAFIMQLMVCVFLIVYVQCVFAYIPGVTQENRQSCRSIVYVPIFYIVYQLRLQILEILKLFQRKDNSPMTEKICSGYFERNMDEWQKRNIIKIMVCLVCIYFSVSITPFTIFYRPTPYITSVGAHKIQFFLTLILRSMTWKKYRT